MLNEIKFIYLRQHEVTSGLTEQQMHEMGEMAKMKQVKKGESIYLADGFDNRIYFVLKGKIKVSEVDDSGNELIKEILHPGDVFGDVGLNGNMREDEFAEAITDNTMICSFNASNFKNMMQKQPQMALNYAQCVGLKLRRMESKHSNLVFKDAKSRLVCFFKDWANREGSRKGNKIILNNYLTHNDIAGIISTSRQSVTTLLNELKDSGMLFYNRKMIEINAPVFVN